MKTKNSGSVIGRMALGILSALAAGITLFPAAGQAEPIPVDDLARLPALTNLSLSRDGDYLVGLIAPTDDDNAQSLSLAVWNPDDLSVPPRIANPDGDVEFIQAVALKAGKILVVARKKWTGALAGCGEGRTIGSTRTYLTKVFVTDTEFSSFDEPFEDYANTRNMSERTRICLEIATTASIREDLPLDEESVIIQRLDKDTLITEFLKYNLRTKETELIYRDDGRESAALLDNRDGTVLTKSDTGFEDGKFQFKTLIRNDETGEFETHDALTWTSEDRHNVSVLGRDEETGKYYVATDQFYDKTQIYFYDPVTRTFEDEPLFGTENFDAGGVILGSSAENFNQLVGFSYEGAASDTIFLDPLLDGVKKSFEKQFPGKNVYVSDWSQDRNEILVTVEGSDMPASYYLYKDKKQLTFLGNERPWIDAAPLSRTELVYYEARDGRSIPALLTLPEGWQEGDAPAPAVVMPHGGPWARDTSNWDPTGWVAFLTSRGLAVLQPQYRGSQGWGRELWMAGDAEWGQKMQDDKDDGAAWMVSQGYADPDRLAIFGYSYGGFAAFAASVRENSPYQCAIAGAGVSELNKLGSTWSSSRLQRLLQGRTVKGMDPIANTDKINIPILIFHGDRDVRVPIYHSRDFYNAVRNKTDAKLVVIDDMPHSLPWTPSMQEEALKAIDTFLAGTCDIL